MSSEMLIAEDYLRVVNDRGNRNLPLSRVYHNMRKRGLFLKAYAKIYRNAGATTIGTDPNDTIQGMSLKKIDDIIQKLHDGTYRWKPSRRIHIPKKNGGERPLSIPNWSDKLVQEVMRMILEAYFEPQFRDSSHGFRPNRSCHTALGNIKTKWNGTKWFIEGDITGCFDHIDHDVLMTILERDIHDGRLLNLIRLGLEAGVMEDWAYRPSHSGVPQGGVLSPLLSNIYLHELDAFIEEVLIPEYTKGKERRKYQEYERLTQRMRQAKKRGDFELAKRLTRERRNLPSRDPNDPDFRRLRYVRYADDFLLSFIGPKSEANAIKAKVGQFLEEQLHLQLNGTKTLITHARTDHARFLGYAINTIHDNEQMTIDRNGKRRRQVNGAIRLGIPYGLIDTLCQQYMRDGKPIHEASLMHYSAAHIIEEYQNRFRGIAGYYKFATGRHKLSKLKYMMEVSLVKTLAHKYKVSVSAIYRRYKGTRLYNGKEYKTLQVEVETQKGVRTIYWGAVPLTVVRVGSQTIEDTLHREQWKHKRSDLIQRLLADTCELCGSHEKVEVHHVRKLANLKKRWAGRKEKPEWVKSMIALRRKTLIVCYRCHVNIHAGRPTLTRQVDEF